MTAAFPEVVRNVSALARDVVLDAELVVPDAQVGRSAFQRLRRRNLLERQVLIDHAAVTEHFYPRPGPHSECAHFLTRRNQ
jgi:ATP-dependent DNA ligase